MPDDLNLIEQYARAFFRRARADFEIFLRLGRVEGVPRCHHLHFLQMACEKLAKAHRFRAGSATPDHLLSSHAQIQYALPQIARAVFDRFDPPGPGRKRRDRKPAIRTLKNIAARLDRLAPSVTDGAAGRPIANTRGWPEESSWSPPNTISRTSTYFASRAG